MSLTFVNIKTGERRVCYTEPMIAAHINTSDRNPNAMQGQDMGWRLSPETIIELERIASDPAELQALAARAGILIDNIAESDILTYISAQDDRTKTGAETSIRDFGREYEDDIRRLREEDAKREQLIAQEFAQKGGMPKVVPLVAEEPDVSEKVNTQADGSSDIISDDGAISAPSSNKSSKKKES